MKTRLLIIIGISVTVFLMGTVFYPFINETTFDDDYTHNVKTALDNGQLYEQNCADAYMVMRDKIMALQKTQFNKASSYVTELDKILEVKKTIHELDCMSNPIQWIHLGAGTEKIKNPSQIQIETSYDVANKIVNHQIVSPKNAVTAKIAAELESKEIEYEVVPFVLIQTDEGWGNPTRLCSTLLYPNGTEFFASATFHPEPLHITGIFMDLERPNGCQKYFDLPRFE